MTTGEPTQENAIDWREAREFLRRRIAREAWRADEETRQDLVQLSLVRLVRAVRRQPVENLEALMNVIARRVTLDWLDSRRVAPPTSSLDDDEGNPLPIAAPREARADLDRLRFTVVSFFTEHSAPCLELANEFFSGRDWAEVAVARNASHAAIRKQWSRCMGQLKQAERERPGLLSEFLEPEELS